MSLRTWEDHINYGGCEDVIAERQHQIAEQRAAIAAIRGTIVDRDPRPSKQDWHHTHDNRDAAWTPERIKSLRRAFGWSQDLMAREIGTAQKTLSGWETGRYRPRMKEHKDRLAELERMAMEGVQ